MPRRRGQQYRRRRSASNPVARARALVRIAKRTGRPEDSQKAVAFIKAHPRLMSVPDLRAFTTQHTGQAPGPGFKGIRRRTPKAAYRRGRYRWLNQPGGGWSPQTPSVIPHQFEPATGYPQTWTAEGGVVPDPLVYEDEPTRGPMLWSEDMATATPLAGYGANVAGNSPYGGRKRWLRDFRYNDRIPSEFEVRQMVRDALDLSSEINDPYSWGSKQAWPIEWLSLTPQEQDGLFRFDNYWNQTPAGLLSANGVITLPSHSTFMSMIGGPHRLDGYGKLFGGGRLRDRFGYKPLARRRWQKQVLKSRRLKAQLDRMPDNHPARKRVYRRWLRVVEKLKTNPNTVNITEIDGTETDGFGAFNISFGESPFQKASALAILGGTAMYFLSKKNKSKKQGMNVATLGGAAYALTLLT